MPLIVVSAHTPAGFISNKRESFGSIIRFVEQNFGIAEGKLDFADFARPERPHGILLRTGAPVPVDPSSVECEILLDEEAVGPAG